MTAKSKWDTLEAKRSAVMNRAWRASDLTIPGLLPRPGHNDSTPLPTPYQSLGARGVNNLASKLLLSLFPPAVRSFRLNLTAKTALALGPSAGKVQAQLAKIEQLVTDDIEASNYRSMLFEGLRHLVVTGNGLLYMPKEGGIKFYRLDQFVIERDGMGNPVVCVIKECLSPTVLDEEVRLLAEIKPDDTADVDLYTMITWEKGRVRYQQEVNGKKIPSSAGDHAADTTPWIPLRWQAVANENYGRSLCMEYLGDLMSVEQLSQAIVEFAEVASKIVILNHPNSTTDSDDLAKAESGDIITGNKLDLDVLQLEKFHDFQVAKTTLDSREQRLSYAFLLQSGTVRDAERVTAEEIRALAQELEDVLGGTYTVLAQELQLPIVRRKLYVMTQARKLPALPKGSVQPVVVTGFAALGRNHSVNKLRAMIADATSLLGQEVAQQWLQPDAVIEALGVGYGVENLDSFIKTPEQVQQEQQQAMRMQAALAAVPHAASAAAKNAASQQPTQ